MPKFAANLSLLFTEIPFLDRFQAAAAAGFEAVECQFPYAFPVADIADKLAANNLQLVLHNLPAGDWGAGERGIACHPARVDEFRQGVAQALAYAQALGVRQLNCLAGIAPGTGASGGKPAPALARQTLIDNLRYAARQLQAHGIRLLIEPINTFDIPGFFLCHSRQALDMIKDCACDNIFLQYDVYHMQRMEGDLTNTLQANLASIGHIQIADNPGRGEPGSGEINFRHLLPMLDKMGYRGWIGCEYLPQNGTLAGLGWRADFD